MPRGYPNTKTQAPAPAGEPAPMIFVEPLPDSAIRINAYGLDAGQIIDTLRRTLLHLVATESGVQVISLDVPPAPAVVASKPPARSKPKTAKPGRNGSKPPTRDLAPVYAGDDFDLEDDQ